MFTLLLMAAAVTTPVDAERAFAEDAQKLGQWTAFRKWSADDALMFTPHPVNAHEFFKDRKDPPAAVIWWPGRSYVACDGSFAVNTGPWIRGWGKAVGYFTTVWRREGDSWRWIYDGGDELEQARGEGGDIQPVQATCPTGNPIPPPPQPEMPQDVKWASGSSKDGTLHWLWSVAPDGARNFHASIWDGREHKVVVADKVAAPPK